MYGAIAGTAASILGPMAIGPAVNYFSGDAEIDRQDQLILQGKDPQKGYKTNLLDRVLYGDMTDESIDKRKDTVNLAGIKKDSRLMADLSKLNRTPELGDTIASLRAEIAEPLEEYGITKARELKKTLAADAFGSEAEVRNRLIQDENRQRANRLEQQKIDQIADEKNYRRYQSGLDREDRRQSRLDRLDSRQQDLDLGMAKLAFQKGQSERDYNLALEKMNRQMTMAKQQRIANIMGGFGQVAQSMF